jgi:hypothetical protein
MKACGRGRSGPSKPAWLAGLVLAIWAAVGIAHAAPDTAREVLADPAFGFCHDERYPLTEDEAEWCPLLPTDDPPCPAFRAACEAPRAVIEGELGPLGTREPGEAEDEREGEPEAPQRAPVDHERRLRDEAEPEREPPSAGPLPHVLVWIIVGAMVLALLLQLRGPAGSRAPPTEAAKDEPAPEAEAEGDAATLPRETDADRLLARATRRAEQGDLAGAVTDGHAALLRRLAERGHVRLHSSRTNGDHVRDLRGEPALHEPTRQVVRIVERVQFGHAPLARAEVDRLLTQVRSVLGTLAGALLLVWTSLACTGDSTKEYPWSHSPSGRVGVIELLRGNGITVEYRTTPLDGLTRGGPTPIVLDGAELTATEESALVTHVTAGGRAVLATREPPPPLAFGIHPTFRGPGPLHPGPLVDSDRDREVVVPGDAGLRWNGVEGEDGVVLRTDAEGTPYVLVRSLGQGEVIVLADDRLLTNAALAVPDDGAFLVELLRDVSGPFELVDGDLRGLAGDGGASDPFDAIARAELTPVIGQVLLLVLLLYLWRGVHFGRPRDPPPLSRRRFSEHVEALAQQYQRAGARRHALHLYAGWALERVHERFGGRRRGLHHLAHRISARTGQGETEIMRTLVEAHHARDDTQDGHGAAEDLVVLRELGRLIDTTAGPKRGPR